MKTPEEKRQAHAEYMRRYNATEKGAKYNREHVRKWRAKNNSPHSAYRPNDRQGIYRRIVVDLLIKRDGMTCGICKEALPDKLGSAVQLDHMQAKMLGGSDTFENVRLVHPHCNLKNAIEIRKKIYGH